MRKGDRVSHQVIVRGDGPRNRPYRVLWLGVESMLESEICACASEGDARFIAKLWAEARAEPTKPEVRHERV